MDILELCSALENLTVKIERLDEMKVSGSGTVKEILASMNPAVVSLCSVKMVRLLADYLEIAIDDPIELIRLGWHK